MPLLEHDGMLTDKRVGVRENRSVYFHVSFNQAVPMHNSHRKMPLVIPATVTGKLKKYFITRRIKERRVRREEEKRREMSSKIWLINKTVINVWLVVTSHSDHAISIQYLFTEA